MEITCKIMEKKGHYIKNPIKHHQLLVYRVPSQGEQVKKLCYLLDDSHE